MAGGSLRNIIMQDAPFAFYPCDELSGTTLTDVSGNARNATYQSTPTWGDTVMGRRGVSTVGANNWADGPTINIDTSDAFTWEALNYTSTINASASGTCMWGGYSAAVGSLGMFAGPTTNDVQWQAGVNGAQFDGVSVRLPNVGTYWHSHIIGVVRAGDPRIFMWINGKKYVNTGSNADRKFNQVIRIGAFRNNGDLAGDRRYWQGGISHLAFWDVGLSENRIRKHIAAAMGRPTRPMALMRGN